MKMEVEIKNKRTAENEDQVKWLQLVATWERERVYLPQNKEQTYKNKVNISAVAGYQKDKPIKLVAYSTNYTGS